MCGYVKVESYWEITYTYNKKKVNMRIKHQIIIHYVSLCSPRYYFFLERDVKGMISPIFFYLKVIFNILVGLKLRYILDLLSIEIFWYFKYQLTYWWSQCCLYVEFDLCVLIEVLKFRGNDFIVLEDDLWTCISIYS